MGKRILAVLAGLITGMIVIGLVEYISHQIYPPPADFDYTNKEALAELMKNIPVGALIIVIIAWAAGSFAGGFVASKIGREKGITLGLIVGAILMLAGIINMLMIPHPIAFWIGGLTVYLPFSYWGAKTAYQ